MPVARVNVNPDVLMWAVEYSQKGMEAFEKKFKKFLKWLDRSERPTVKQLEAVAKFSHVPFGYLMLSEKPNIKITPIADFRTKGNHGFVSTGEYSPELRDTFIDIRRRQAWLREYKEEQDYAPVPFIGSISRDMEDAVILKTIRDALGIPADWQSTSKVADKFAAFRYFLDIVESKGIAVFINGIVGNNTRRVLSVEEFRGFALSDKIAPVIFINGGDAPAGRLFTLLHELVHLFLGQDGLDDRTEPFCNHIAARLLVPSKIFETRWQEHPNDFDTLEHVFKVSQLVLYRMALDLHKITKEKYADLVRQYTMAHAKTKKAAGGGDFYKAIPYKMGRSFARYVKEALSEGNVSYPEAYRLLGIRGSTFDHAMNAMEGGI